MPPELSQFLVAWAGVSVVAVPLAAVLWLAGGRGPLCPAWKPPPFRGTALDFLLLYLAFIVVTSVGITTLPQLGVTGVQVTLLAQAVALPAVLGAAAWLRSVVHDLPTRFDFGTLPGDIARGLLAGVAFTPVVHGVYAAARLANAKLGGAETSHPLADAGPGDGLAQVLLFFVCVCGIVPWLEEFLFRGVMLRWLARNQRNAAVVYGLAGLFAYGLATPDNGPIAVGFVAGVAAVGVLVEQIGRGHRRVPKHLLRAALASSALFAAVHANVWPSPVPLTVLACGLGYLCLRTGRVTAAVVAHGTFNAVSVLIVLRHPPG